MGVLEDKGAQIEEHARLAAGRAGAPFLTKLREEALARFRETGWPKPRDEDWIYTNVGPIVRSEFRPAPAPAGNVDLGDLATGPIAGEGAACRLVFVDGRFDAKRSALGAGDAIIAPLSSVLAEDPARLEAHLGRLVDAERQNAFAAMNTAFFADGAYVGVPDGVTIDAPIHVVHVATGGGEPTIVHPRTLIAIGRGARATVVEAYVGNGRYLTNAVAETFVDDGGRLESIVVENESAAAYHFASRQIAIGRGVRSAERHFSFGAAVVRGDFGLRTDGGQSEGTLGGLYLADGERHVDFHTTIDHAVPEAVTHELFKGVLGGKSSAAFRGRIIVREDAQKTDAFQTNRHLLLSRHASANSRPQLEIYADDVKCSHGATVGELDDEALFYFRSRGIPRREAHALLTYAFAGELVEPIEDQALHDALAALVHKLMPADSV